MTATAIGTGQLLRERSRRRFPWVLSGTSVLVVGGLLLPLSFLVFEATQVGWRLVWSLLDRSIVAGLLWNTIRLAAAVTFLCAVIGTGAAWLTERTALPGRRVWAVLLVLPLVIPDFVVAWTWSSIFPSVHGYFGAVLVMTLGLYPLVYLPMAAAFRGADPGQEEAARSLGLSRLSVWLRISVRQAHVTLLGSCLLVCLALLAEYGAFENLQYQTFTTAIFTELQIGFATAAACALSLALVGLSVLVLLGEALFRERGRLQRAGPQVSEGREAAPARESDAARSARRGWRDGIRSRVPARRRLVLARPRRQIDVAGNSLGGLCCRLQRSLQRAGGAHRHRARAARHAPRGTPAGALVGGTRTQRLHRAGASGPRHRPGTRVRHRAIHDVRVPKPGAARRGLLDDLLPTRPSRCPVLCHSGARGAQGDRPVPRERSCHGEAPSHLAARRPWPGRGVLPGVPLGSDQLTATLLLVPNNVQTLATQFWSFTENVSYGAAAPYAATMIAMSIVPGYLLSRWFDRRSTRTTATAPSAVATPS